MTFRELAVIFERLDEITARNAMIEILAEVYGAQVAVAAFALAGASLLIGVHVLRTLHERREAAEPSVE